VCVSVPRLFSHYCMDPDVTWGNGRECPLVVHYWSDLQSVHWFHCYDNRAPNTKCQRVLVLALCLVINSPGEYFNNHIACAMLLTDWKKQLTDVLFNRQQLLNVCRHTGGNPSFSRPTVWIWVKILCPTQHKIGYFRDVPQTNRATEIHYYWCSGCCYMTRRLCR